MTGGVASDAAGAPVRRQGLFWLTLLLLVALALAGGLALGPVEHVSDAVQYLRLAAGQPVMMPFASRQLGPLLVHGLTHLLPPLSIVTGFVLEGVVALVAFAGLVLVLLLGRGVPARLLPFVAGLFLWALLVHGLILPDLLYAALFAALLLCLDRGWHAAAALLFFPLALTRETTVLVLLCLLAAGSRRLPHLTLAGAAAATAAGLGLAQHLAANALPNREHVSAATYLLGKVPWNLARNLLGVELWANVYPQCTQPVWQIALPFDRVRAVGICGVALEHPAYLGAALLGSFGLLPLLALRLWRPIVERYESGTVAFRLAALAGLLFYLAAPALGDSVQRLLGYGWPLFLVALPWVLAEHATPNPPKAPLAALLALHLVSAWAMAWRSAPFRLLLLECLCYAAAAWLTSGPTRMGRFFRVAARPQDVMI